MPLSEGFRVRVAAVGVLAMVFLAWAPSQEAEEIYQNFLAKSEAYRNQVELYLEVLQQQIESQAHKVDDYRQAYRMEIISRLELDEQEAELERLQGLAQEQSEKLTVTDQAMVELKAVYLTQLEEKNQPKVQVMRYDGKREWELRLAGEVADYFEREFGRELPISAYGQTDTHDLLGFDHRERVDLALHPATLEGKALLAYLRQQEIPYVAFSGAVTGQATGAHIHLGPPSPRMFKSH